MLLSCPTNAIAAWYALKQGTLQPDILQKCVLLMVMAAFKRGLAGTPSERTTARRLEKARAPAPIHVLPGRLQNLEGAKARVLQTVYFCDTPRQASAFKRSTACLTACIVPRPSEAAPRQRRQLPPLISRYLQPATRLAKLRSQRWRQRCMRSRPPWWACRAAACHHAALLWQPQLR